MKHTKKLVALLFALVMVFAMGISASAANPVKFHVENNSNHLWGIYQIFTGEVKDGELVNLKYGSQSTGKAGTVVPQDVLKELDSVSEASDAEKLAVIGKYANISGKPKVSFFNKTAHVAPGYYLVADKGLDYYLRYYEDEGKPVPDGDSYSTYMVVKVTGEMTVTPKISSPTAEKKVKDINDSTGEATEWIDSADYDIGDEVPFQLKATLAENVSTYETYKVIFHDTVAAGLTYNGDAVVKIDDVETKGFTIDTAANEDGTTALTISSENVKNLGATDGSVITVEYTAVLNENAVIGADGNVNKMYLEYSNNLAKSGTENNETGNTPEDIVKVFTYQTIINKVDPEGNALPGAEFKLEKKQKDGNWKSIVAVKNEEGTTFTFSGLDDGEYLLTEDTAPKGYTAIEPVEFTITAGHDIESDNSALVSLDGEGEGEITLTANVDEGSLSADITNQKGLTLPETGGMGTTLFYVLGSILALGAGILLVNRKRMSADR